MTGRIASQAPFILLPRYGEKYEGMARQIKDVIGVARQQARSPEDLAFAEYVASNTVGARMGRAINRRQVAMRPDIKGQLLNDQYFGAGTTIDPFFLPYKAGFDRTINDFLSSRIIPYKGDMVEKVAGIDYQDRLASIAHIPKMMERWENLPKVEKAVHRGIADDRFFWTKDKEPQARFTSASQDLGIAQRFAQAGRPEGGQIVTIASNTGRRLAAKDGEEEVLFAPMTSFVKLTHPNFPVIQEKAFRGEPLSEKESKILNRTVYMDKKVSSLPPIPSYDELKLMSKQYGNQARHNQLLKDIDYAKAKWSWTEAPQEAIQESLSNLEALANKVKGDYDYREVKQALSKQYDFIGSFVDEIPF